MRSRVESEISAEETRGLQAAEEKIGVGDGGLSAASVADGPGIGSGGLGTDAEDASSVEAGEGASAGADGVDVEHGNADGKACDLGIGRSGNFIFDQGNVGGGAAHVEGDDAVEAAGAGGGGRADDASGRTGEDGAHGFAGGGRERGDAAAGLHNEDVGRGGFRFLRSRVRGAQASLFHQFARAVFQIFQVALHYRLQVGVDDDRRGAFVLAEFGEDLVGDGKRNSDRLQGLRDGFFVFGICEREEQGDRDGLRVCNDKLFGEGFQFSGRRCGQNVSVTGGAFVDSEAEIFRD